MVIVLKFNHDYYWDGTYMASDAFNLRRVSLYSVLTFCLVYMAYLPELFVVNSVRTKAEQIAQDAASGAAKRIKSLTDANDLGGIMGMVDAFAGGGGGISGLASKTIGEAILKPFPARISFDAPQILHWAVFGLLLVAAIQIWSLIVVKELRSRLYQQLACVLGTPLIVAVCLLFAQFLTLRSWDWADHWNTVLYGTTTTLIVLSAINLRPVQPLLAGVLGLCMYTGLGVIRDGYIPGYHHATLESARLFGDVKANVIDPKLAELSELAIVGPIISDFVNQAWNNPDFAAEVSLIKAQSSRAAESLRMVGTAEVVSGWLEAFAISLVTAMAISGLIKD